MAVSRLLPLLTHTQRAALIKHYRELNILHPEWMMGAKTTEGATLLPPLMRLLRLPLLPMLDDQARTDIIYDRQLGPSLPCVSVSD